MRRLLILYSLIAPHLVIVAGFSASSATPSNTSGSNNEDNHATWEDIGRHLLGLRKGGIPDHELMMTRLDIPHWNKVKSAESKVPGAGRGLFAATDIKKGELITCYPGDILLQPNGLLGVPEYLEKDEKLLRTLLFKYSVGSIRDGIAVMGLPEKVDDMAYAGHLINDGAKPPTNEAELERYVQESEHCRNVEHCPLENIHMVTIALRDIKAGEELLVSYGPVYWMDHAETWRGDSNSGTEEFIKIKDS